MPTNALPDGRWRAVGSAGHLHLEKIEGLGTPKASSQSGAPALPIHQLYPDLVLLSSLSAVKLADPRRGFDEENFVAWRRSLK